MVPRTLQLLIRQDFSLHHAECRLLPIWFAVQSQLQLSSCGLRGVPPKIRSKHAGKCLMIRAVPF
jgi:hypothetical protein